MSIELSHEIKKAGTIILPATGLLLGFVWSYLEKVLPINTKQEVSTLYLMQLVLSALIIILALSAFIVFLLIWRKKEIRTATDKQPDEKIETNKKDTPEDQLNRTILLQVLKLRGLNQVASPKNIATQMNQDTGIVLAHLNKLHNDQYVTFQTGGSLPTADTDFFLSPKALQIINLSELPQRAKPKNPLSRPRSSWVKGWKDW